MYQGLDFYPPAQIQGTLHIGAGADVLERRVDPDCVAGAILWDLYKQFYDAEHARIRVPYDTLCQIGSGGRACRPMRLGRGLGLAGRGAGLLICADRSCLVIRTAKSEPWPLGGLHATFVDILPIALHLPKIIPYGDDRAALLEVGGLDLKEACLSFELMSLAERRSGESDAEDVQRSLLAQVCWEATSWGSCLDGLPPLDPSGAWPAAFPVDPPSADLLASFQSRARQAAQFLLITESTLIEAVKLRIYSALPLQGGVSPARLSASFFSRSGDVLEALEHDRLVARLERMIFAPDAPCRADRIVAQRLVERKDAGRRLVRIALCELSVKDLPSNHEILHLHRLFAAA